MKPYADLSDQRVVKALAHPLRVQILGLLEHQTASPSELAAELRVPLGNVSYHVRQLQSFGLIRLVRTTPRRGSIEHHYELVARPDITDQAWDGLPDIVKHAMVGAALAPLGRHVNDAAAAGGFSRREAHLSRTALDARRRGLARGLRPAGRHVRPPRGRSSTRASSGSRTAEGRAVALDGRAHALRVTAGARGQPRGREAPRRRGH